jgi:hypothetical protein
MKISGFTIVRNALKYNYPAVEAIKSILPVCDEFIINVGDSQDATLELMQKLQSDFPGKVRIIQNLWDMDESKTVLSRQTNLALKECTGDWAFYLQSDEMVHQDDVPRLKGLMRKYLHDTSVDALRLCWLHFYGSYYRYRIDHGWFQKQDRIIRNNGEIESMMDAWAFRRKDGKPLRTKRTNCLLYHYGWVHPGDIMTQRRLNAELLWGKTVEEEERERDYSYGDLNRFPPYFGSHPSVMKEKVEAHPLSQQDLKDIARRYWWHPMKILKARYKTWKRVKRSIP